METYMKEIIEENFKHRQFLRMGFDDFEAIQAVADNIDWHDVENLLKAGCDRETALRIAC